MLSSRRWTVVRTLVAALLLLPGIASAQARSVVGTYNTTITSPQGAVKAVIVLKGGPGAFTGTLAAEGFPEIPVSNVVPSDTGVTLMGDSPDGGVNVSMKFAGGDKVSGKVVYQGMEMVLDGTFSPSGSAPAAASASGTAVASAAGTYELKSTESLMGMSEFPVTCVVTMAANGAYAGTCGNDQGGAAIAALTVAGNVVTMTGDSPAGPFKAVFTIDGRAAAGTLTLGAETAKMKGTFAPK
ncbi:MAG: hypothetical protein H7099_11350 [Gemmatimonadaceae bacterium]|nr:hypothetical protein [Gemmatimonadaceae bacterium]